MGVCDGERVIENVALEDHPDPRVVENCHFTSP